MSGDRLRIAMVVGQFPAHSTTFIVNQICGLLERGHEVDVIAGRRGPDEAVDETIRQSGLLARTTWIDLPESRIIRVAKASLGLAMKMPSSGRALLRSFNRRRYGPMASAGALLFGAFKLLDRRQYDVIHSHFAPNGLAALYYREAGLLSGALVTSLHGYDINVYPKANGKDVYRALFEEGDLFMANTHFIAERAKALGCPGDRLVRHPMGVDRALFEFKERRMPKDRRVRIVATGRLVEVKGFVYLLRAVAIVRRKHPNVSLEILGDGPLRSSLEALTRELSLSGSVEWAGGITPAEVQKRYARADLFAMACVRSADGAEEGQGVVFAEAQACGLPIVATRTGGIPEAVQDGVSGFLVEERDPQALAERLEWLIEHPEAWASMGRAGRSFVEKEYDSSTLNAALETHYREVLERVERETLSG
jgi:colanic acid/amylovoran biosynthesis glycosyltransferase